MHDAILSTNRTVSTDKLVYSSLGAYGSRRGGELPGTWFVRAFGDMGREAGGVRQTLFRMERNGELESRKVGRTKLYRLSPFGVAAVNASSRKLFDPTEDAWDGRWTLVRYHFDGEDRLQRDRVRHLLEWEGFAPLGRGVYIHPRDRADELLSGLADLTQAGDIMIFHADRIGGESNVQLVGRLWNLSCLDAEYRDFVPRFSALARRKPQSWKPRTAFLTRFALVTQFLQIAWSDPDLPSVLLPARWRGQLARDLARQLYENLLPATLQHADIFLDMPTGHDGPS